MIVRLATLVVLVSLAGCAEAAEPSPMTPEGRATMTVVLDADEDMVAIADRLFVERTADGAVETSVVPFRAGEPGATRFPVTLTIVEPEDGGPIELVADVLDASRAVAARQRATIVFAPGEQVRLRFETSCLLELCDEGTSCDGGSCVSACMMPSTAGEVTRIECTDLPEPMPMPMPDDPTSCDDDHADAMFCDGFESTLDGRWTSLNEGSGGMLDIVGDPLHRGVGSLGASTTGSGSVSSYLRKDLGAAPSDLYVRVWAFVPADAVMDDVNLAFVGGGGDAGLVGMTLGIDGANAYHRWYPVAAGAEAPFPRDQWVCLEAHAGPGGVELWVDDASARADVAVSMPTSGFGANVGIGIAPRATSPIEVWLDEVVIDDARIGCD